MTTMIPSKPAQNALASIMLTACVALFAIAGTLVALNVPFPTAYDELQHLSFMHALREAPTPFPRYGTYSVLDPTLSYWTATQNYIAHPPLYYLLLAPLGDNVMTLRLINLALATTGWGLCAVAGCKLLVTDVQRGAFLILLLVFSKPALLAGMINNDNLVLFETGLVLWCMTSSRPRASRIAILLAVVGWTKFNAFVGLTTWIGLWHVFAIMRRDATLFSRQSVALIFGVLLGAIPTIVNLATLHSAVFVPVDFLYVEPSERPSYDFLGFANAFIHKIGMKVFFVDGFADLTVFIAALVLAANLACFSRTASPRVRDIAVAGSLATLAFATLHIAYGWRSFQTLGTMSDAQSRYYVMLWPALALAAVVGGSALMKRVYTRTSGQQTLSA